MHNLYTHPLNAYEHHLITIVRNSLSSILSNNLRMAACVSVHANVCACVCVFMCVYASVPKCEKSIIIIPLLSEPPTSGRFARANASVFVYHYNAKFIFHSAASVCKLSSEDWSASVYNLNECLCARASASASASTSTLLYARRDVARYHYCY